jgi:MATE family multidrug resistance protein
MLKIAVPVVMAELGWMTMGVVDTVMVGPLGPEAISAAGVGNFMHIAFAIFGMAVMLGLDTLVSHAYGARDIRDCHRWFFDGLTLAGLLAVPIMALLVLVWFAIPSLGFHGAVRPLLESYYGILLLSTPFLLAYAVCRRYPAGDARGNTGDVRARHGQRDQRGRQLGSGLRPPRFPALGVAGSAWATVISRAYMMSALLIAVWWIDRKRTREAGSTVMGVARRSRLQRHEAPAASSLGLPAASQVGAEVGVFALATAMSGTLDPSRAPRTRSRSIWQGVAFMIRSDSDPPARCASATRSAPAIGRAPRLRAGRRSCSDRLPALAATIFILVPGS